jgi:ammonia channel protein AmtB
MDTTYRAVVASMSGNRRFRAPAYVVLTLAALSSVFISRPPSIDAALITDLQYVWASIFAIGSFACFIGAITDRWEFEYYMIWPLILTFAIYALAIAMQVIPIGIEVLPTALTMAGLSLMFHARWRDVHAISRLVVRLESEREGAP